MPNNYNKIAKYYDLISSIVFQKNIIKAQVSLLQFIPENSTVLIVGGGTGWILEELSKLYTGLSITYVDISSAMIALAKKKDCKTNKVDFIDQPIESFTPAHQYSVIITAFLFDNFLQDKIEMIFAKLNALLKDKGIWLFADFIYEKNKTPLWQSFLLKTMYFFFRITCNIEAKELVDMDPYFRKGYEKIFEKRFYWGFIKAMLCKKNHTEINVPGKFL